VGASRGLKPGAIPGEGSAGDNVAGDAIRGLRKGLFDVFCGDSGSVNPAGEGRRTVFAGGKLSVFEFLSVLYMS
jgi:hypothetical protein